MARILCSGAIGFLFIASSCAAAVQPVAQYRLGEDDPGAGASSAGQATTLDHGPSHLDLTRSGTPHYSSDVAPGAAAATGSTLSMQFKSSSLDVYWRDPIALPADNFGIETWVKTAADPAAGSQAVIVSDGTAGTNGVGFVRTANATPLGGTEAVYAGMFGGTTIGFSAAPAGQWVHLAMVRSAGIDTFYINGQSAGTGSTPASDPGLAFTIAASYCPQCASVNPTSSAFDGNVDEVRLFTFQPGQFNAATDLLYSAVPEPAALLLAALLTILLLARPRQMLRTLSAPQDNESGPH